MTVIEAIALLSPYEMFYLKGTYSGKVYYHKQKNKKERLEKYLNETVNDQPFFADLFTPKMKYSRAYTYPIIGIWMHDYNLCKQREAKEER